MAEPIISNAAALTGWRKSSYSGSEGGSCLEVVDDHPIGVPVRDSKAPEGPALVFRPAGWTPFVAAVKDGSLSA
ncbi:DUF397 domain-containing protein [Streptomyces althioticus]|jgi:hypothetical protein|uniref:DUF397 domain-containing protein n=1 Tax=Streptomyces TaxID=1883 RepID=UPI00073A874B|nr:DUF397 domain-containing protein [Streptomyces lusitanus]ALV50309.1 hypothetical protein ASR50_13425 [Streptomyces sp. 4F]MCC9686172.1 DUF397 domain-containing protein [Streptomyces sp. MNU103]WTB99179.1 DUF397 domain-containing protein [Streptomyces althioticus]GGQ95681.1 hypothetical protein GCM10010267_67850 [Streptomyces griseorubens]WTC25080.1 DUF397 domain-containing protein [Streptomyces althioticus]